MITSEKHIKIRIADLVINETVSFLRREGAVADVDTKKEIDWSCEVQEIIAKHLLSVRNEIRLLSEKLS